MTIINYEALTDDEINQERGILQPGVYPAQISSAEPKTSKSSGNQMAALKVKVWDDAGRVTTIFDYMVFTRKMAWKLKHFWESVGNPDKYNGAFNCDEIAGLECFVSTDLEETEKGQRAKIKDYITQEEYKIEKAGDVAVQNKLAESKPDFDDDIKF